MGMKDDAYSLLMKARQLLTDRHPHQAAIVLERAIVLEPEKTSIRESLARALFNSGQTARAKEQFQIMVDADPSNDYAHFGLALCQAKTGERRAATGHLKIAVAMRPDSEIYRTALSVLGG